jgi:hypothetical protein
MMLLETKIFPRVTRLYWMLRKIPAEGIEVYEFDIPTSVRSTISDIKLLKRMGFVSFKLSKISIPEAIKLVRLPELEELQKYYLAVKMHRYEVFKRPEGS